LLVDWWEGRLSCIAGWGLYWEYICQKLRCCEFSFFKRIKAISFVVLCCVRGAGVLSMYAVYFYGLFPSLLCGLGFVLMFLPR
jgi:hypothetical protein